MPYLQLQSAFGLLVLIALCWAISENRKAFSWKFVLIAIGLQLAIAAALLGLPPARVALQSLNAVVDALLAASIAGSSFVFGYVGGGQAPFEVSRPDRLFSLAFQALPLILVMSALSALLWYWRVLPWIVKGVSFVLQRSLKIGGAVGTAAGAEIFLGMIEAPLLIRPYLSRLTRAELFMVFTLGEATVAGTVMVLYATVIGSAVPDALGHIIVASVISLPSAILAARLMIPGESTTGAEAHAEVPYRSSIDAIARGTEDGLKLYLSVIAMLLVFVALVALVNVMLGALPDVWGAKISVERIFGAMFAPLAWLYGIPWEEAPAAGVLLGTKTVLNEFIAYIQLGSLEPGVLSERSRLIMLYAMCGFANFGSVGIMIGAISAMVPERRHEVAELSLKALVSGTLATGMTGAVVGIIV